MLKSLAGAGGFEPPYGGIKIRCLTTWLRPNSRRITAAALIPLGGRADHSGGALPDQCPASVYIYFRLPWLNRGSL